MNKKLIINSLKRLELTNNQRRELAKALSTLDDIEYINKVGTFLNDKIEANSEKITALTNRMVQAELKINNLIEDLSDLVDVENTHYQELKNNYTTLLNTVTSFKSSYDEFVTETNRKFTTIDTNISNVTNELNTVKNKVTEAETKVNQFTETIANINTQIDNLNNRLDNISDGNIGGGITDEEKAEIDNKIEQVNSSITQVNNSLNSAKNDITSLRGDVNDITQSITTITDKHNQDINTITTNINNINERITNINNEIDGVLEDIENINTSITTNTNNISNLTTKVNTNTTEISSIKTNLQTINNNIPTKVSQLTNDSEFQTKTQVNTAIQKVVGSAPEALDTLEEIAAKLNDNDDVVSGIVNTLSEKASNTAVNNLNTKFTNNINNINDNITSINNSINDIESDITSINESVDTLNSLNSGIYILRIIKTYLQTTFISNGKRLELSEFSNIINDITTYKKSYSIAIEYTTDNKNFISFNGTLNGNSIIVGNYIDDNGNLLSCKYHIDGGGLTINEFPLNTLTILNEGFMGE